MELIPENSPGLPLMAWVARRPAGARAILVEHGPGVEVGPDFFFEGAWAGEFAEGRPDRTECVFGSGAVAGDREVTIVPSLATCDAIHWVRLPDGEVVISNSLSLLLARTGRRLDVSFSAYDRVNDSVVRGIDQYASTLPSTGGPIRRLVFHNLKMTDGDSEILERKPSPPRFPSYGVYRGYLEGSMGRLLENARDPARSAPLRILTTQSRGYDTTAVNALASASGLDLALTVTTAKQVGRYAGEERGALESDDGTEICRLLGIPVARIERFAYREDPESEILFRAGIHSCQDLNLLGIREHLDGPSLLLTGIRGAIWYPRASMGGRPVSNDLATWDRGGYGLGEVRLWLGFAQAAFPFVGARRATEIVRITESAEMDPWRLGRTYDRPIPRRIAEEAGIPREWFGQRKMATVVERPEPELPLTPQLRAEYLEWLADTGLRSRSQIRAFPVVHAANTAIMRRNLARFQAIYYGERIVSRLLRRDWRLPKLWMDLRGRLYVYAVNRLADRLASR